MLVKTGWAVVAGLLLGAAAPRSGPRSAPPPPPAAHPLEKTFAKGEEAERVWRDECPVREVVAVGEKKLLELGAAKVLSEEVPIAVFALERSGKVRAAGVGVGLTVLRVQLRKGGQQLVCVRVAAPPSPPAGFDPAELPSPGPCAVPKNARAMLSQSATLELGSRMLLPMPGWKRFEVDAPDQVKVVGTSPDELVLEAKAPGTTQLRVCLASRVEVIHLRVEAAAAP